MSKNENVIVVPGNEWRNNVQKELERLTDRLIQLRKFMLTEDFLGISERQRNLLRDQSAAMSKYADILTMRLSIN